MTQTIDTERSGEQMPVPAVARAIAHTAARSRPLTARLGAAAAAILLAACAGGGGTGGGYGAGPAAGDAAEPTADYRIGAGDRLEIFVWRNPEISTSVPVRPDGMISMPLVEDMPAEGKTPTELANDIEVVLAEYIRSPQVNVIVENFVGTFGDQIRVVGQAANPQAVPYRTNMTLLDVMIEVGGLGEFAAGNRSKVIRRVNGEQQEIKVRLHDLMNKGELEHNIRMMPGDVVMVPESLF